jgi:hypothetical protein
MELRTQKKIWTMLDKVAVGKETSFERQSRRVWLQNFALASATGAVMWACGKDDDDANAACSTTLSKDDKIADAKILNVALELEHEAIALYTAAAGFSGGAKDMWASSVSALAPSLLAVAKEFAAHHTAHAATLKGAIDGLQSVTGVAAVTAKTADDYLKWYDLSGIVGDLPSLIIILQLAAEREMNAANVYHSVVGSFKDKTYIPIDAGLAVDEAAHYGVLNAAAFALGALSSTSTTVAITDKNIVAGSLPPFGTYPRAIRKASI